MAIVTQQEYSIAVKKSAYAVVFIGATGNQKVAVGVGSCCPTYGLWDIGAYVPGAVGGRLDIGRSLACVLAAATHDPNLVGKGGAHRGARGLLRRVYDLVPPVLLRIVYK